MKKKTILIYGIAAILVCIIAFFIWNNLLKKNTYKYAYIPTALVDAPSTLAVENLVSNGITPVPFSTGIETVQSLLGGASYVATLAEWPFLLAADKQKGLRILAVITSARSMGIIANRTAGIDSINQLAGKRVGFPQGTSAQFVLESLTNEVGVLEDVIPVNLTPPNLQPALVRGDIDAMVIWQPFLEKAKLENPNDFIYLPGSQDPFRVVYCIVSTEQNIKNNPEVIRKILEALIVSVEELNSGSDEVLIKLSEKTGLELNMLKTLRPLFNYKVALDNEIINVLNMLSVWSNSSGITTSKDITEWNWEDFIYTKSLESIEPDSVNIQTK